MPIVGLQRTMREIGRIRTGNQVVKNNRRLPNKLATFRLTSQSQDIILAAARVHGGEPAQWDNNGTPEWEVVTTTPVMDIVVPPGQIISQWNELYIGGGCLRRCDGEWNQIDGKACGSTPSYIGQQGDKVIPPCSQNIAERVEAAKNGLACKTTTRLSVIMPELPDLGVWVLVTHSYNAAVHLAGAADVLRAATDRGMLIPARLRLVEDSKRVPGQATHSWYEPVIEFPESAHEMGLMLGRTSTPALALGAPPPLPMIAAPVSSDFRAPEPPVLIERPVAAGTCGWSLRPQRGGADIPCSFDQLHDGTHSWHEQRAGGRVVPPAEDA